MLDTCSTKSISERQQNLSNKTLNLCCLVPVYNEETHLLEFLTQLGETLAEISNEYSIICVNDGSSDNSESIIQQCAKSLPIKSISLSRNFGKEIAISAGLEHSDSDAIIIIDSDFQHPFSIIKEFVDEWATGFDMVYGIRRSRNQESGLRRLFTNCFYRVMRFASQVNIIPNAGDFRLLDKRVVKALCSCQERSKFMKGLYAWVGYSSKPIFYNTNPRATGKSTFGFLSLLELSITGITAFSNIPLRAWTLIGASISSFSFIFAIYIAIKTMVFGTDLPGYTSVIVGIFFFGGVQLLSIGILGEYIARIFNEVKNRPAYIVKSKIGF
ncbi:MAG: glycosyltransferase family 2 protein [Francisellaceae bacterium]|nr:glycosyltransferase family 2 protein [Francisellaceae bacterium]